MTKFKARIEAETGGGHYVVVPADAAVKAKLEYRMRVRGTVGGVAYRSSLMKCDGVFQMGVHKATLAKAKLAPGATATIEIERDDAPLPEDTVPPLLEAALKKDRAARAAWDKLAPSHRREHARAINDAKKEETRKSRVEKCLAMLKG
jgi:hypothetical protein